MRVKKYQQALVILHVRISNRARIIGTIGLYKPVETSSSKYNNDVISSSVCVSLDEPEPVDSALTFPSGYDTLEYSWVKGTAVSMRLRIYS